VTKNNPFWSNLFKKQDDAKSKITDLWLQTPLFENVPTSICRKLVENMHPRYYKKDEAIFNQGELGAGAVLITSGKVIIKSSDQVLAELAEGDFFGEVALVLDEPRTADAVASEDCELVFLIKQDVNEWVNQTPRYGAIFMKNIAHLIATRLKRANQLLSDGNNN
jgi:CRP-like cAMP-binding protein